MPNRSFIARGLLALMTTGSFLAAPIASAQRVVPPPTPVAPRPPSPPPAALPTAPIWVDVASLAFHPTSGNPRPTVPPPSTGGQSWVNARAVVDNLVEDGPLCAAKFQGVFRVGRLEVWRQNVVSEWKGQCITDGGTIANQGRVLVDTTANLSWVPRTPTMLNRAVKVGTNDNGSAARVCRGKVTYRVVNTTIMDISYVDATLEGTLWGDQCSVLVRGQRQLVPATQILIWQGSAG